MKYVKRMTEPCTDYVILFCSYFVGMFIRHPAGKISIVGMLKNAAARETLGKVATLAQVGGWQFCTFRPMTPALRGNSPVRRLL